MTVAFVDETPGFDVTGGGSAAGAAPNQHARAIGETGGGPWGVAA